MDNYNNFDMDDVIYINGNDDPFGINDVLLKMVELMDEKFFEVYKRYEIYSYFETNYLKYLQNFSSINDLKYFGYFFKLLPPELYQKSTADFVLNWLEKKINTYDEDKYPDFISQLEIFFSILTGKNKYQLSIKFLSVLKANLAASFMNNV